MVSNTMTVFNRILRRYTVRLGGQQNWRDTDLSVWWKSMKRDNKWIGWDFLSILPEHDSMSCNGLIRSQPCNHIRFSDISKVWGMNDSLAIIQWLIPMGMSSFNSFRGWASDLDSTNTVSFRRIRWFTITYQRLRGFLYPKIRKLTEIPSGTRVRVVDRHGKELRPWSVWNIAISL